MIQGVVDTPKMGQWAQQLSPQVGRPSHAESHFWSDGRVELAN